MDDKKKNIKFKGILIGKEETKSENPKAPAGLLKFEELDNKITVWDRDLFKSLIENVKYEVIYNHSSNESRGRVYHNYNLDQISEDSLNVDLNKVTTSKETIEDMKNNGLPTEHLVEGDGEIPWNLLGYPLKKDNSVKELVVPEKVFAFLIKVKSEIGSRIIAAKSDEYEDYEEDE